MCFFVGSGGSANVSMFGKNFKASVHWEGEKREELESA